MNSKYKRLLKDTFIFALGSLGSKFLLFLMVPLYTNYMTTEEYAIADLLFTVAQFLIPFFSVVIFDAVIRFGLSKSEKTENVLLAGMVVLSAASILTIATTPLVGLYKPISEWKWYLSVYVIFSMANSVEMNYLKVKNKNKLYSLLSVLQTGIMAGLNVLFLVMLHAGVKGYLCAYIISNIVIVLFAFLFGGMLSDLIKAKLDARLLREMLVYSTPLILNNVSWWVIHSSDKVMVEAMIGTASLGIYSVSVKIPSLINVFVTIFQQAWGISSVREIESSNDTSFYASVFRTYNILTTGACIMLVSVIKVFMKYYVGANFQDAWKYVPLLLVSAVFAAVASFYGSLYGALKKSMNNMITTVTAAIVNIAVNYLLIPVVGIWGAVIGTVVSYIVIGFLRIMDVGRYIHIEIGWLKFLANTLLIIIQAVFVSFDWHIYVVSLCAIVIFCMINAGDIRRIVSSKGKRKCKS